MWWDHTHTMKSKSLTLKIETFLVSTQCFLVVYMLIDFLIKEPTAEMHIDRKLYNFQIITEHDILWDNYESRDTFPYQNPC